MAIHAAVETPPCGLSARRLSEMPSHLITGGHPPPPPSAFRWQTTAVWTNMNQPTVLLLGPNRGDASTPNFCDPFNSRHFASVIRCLAFKYLAENRFYSNQFNQSNKLKHFSSSLSAQQMTNTACVVILSVLRLNHSSHNVILELYRIL